MEDGVLHQWLQNHLGYLALFRILGNLQAVSDLILKTHPDHIEIFVYNTQLVFQVYQKCPLNRIAEQVCHVGADLGDLLDSVHQGDTSHTLEHVVEEMWINLALIGIELRLLFAQFHLIQPCLGGYIVLVERENPL